MNRSTNQQAVQAGQTATGLYATLCLATLALGHRGLLEWLMPRQQGASGAAGQRVS